MSVTVHIASFPNLAAESVAGKLDELYPEFEAAALLYTPAECVVARVSKDGFARKDGGINPRDAYEIIVFCTEWEFRWLRDGAGGDGRLVSETESAGAHECEPRKACGVNDVRYLVWGEKFSQQDGWVTLSDGQIGSLDLPVKDGGAAQRKYVLTAREYFVREDTHGNVGVGLQRLMTIRPWTADSGKGSGP